LVYNKQTWQNNPPSTATPISAARLNHLETQYDEAMTDVAASVGDPESPIGAELNATIGDLIETTVLIVDAGDTYLDLTRRFQWRDTVGARGSVFNIEHYGDGSGIGSSQTYAIDIHNNPGARSALVIHQYSSAQAAVQIDNTDATAAIIIKNTNNPTRNPSGAAAGESATGDFVRFLNTTGALMFRVLGRGEVIITPGPDATGHAIEVVGRADSNKKLLRLTGNGPQIAAEIIANAGSAGFYPLLVSGYDYGPRFTTSQNGSNRFALELIKSGTGNGDALRIVNQGTGKTATFRTASATEVAAINADGEYEHMTAGKGIILRSPDGTRYRITVADGGAVSAVTA
jgi:hypothetical protein